MSHRIKTFTIAILLLTVAVFGVGGGNSDNRFLASIGLSDIMRPAGSWNELENFTAVNLAGEGIEAFRAVRNINLVKFDKDPEHCWNMSPEVSSDSACESPNLIKAGFYAVKRAGGVNLWTFDFVGSDSDGAIADGADGHYRIDFISDSFDGYPSTILARPENDAVFFRMVEVGYESPEVMKITVTVQWESGGEISETSLSTFLTNH